MAKNRLNPASPLVLNAIELSRSPGSVWQHERTVPAPDGLGNMVIGVPPEADIDLDLLLTAVSEGVLLTGTARATAVGECVRCLDEVDADLSVQLEQFYLYPAEAAKAKAEAKAKAKSKGKDDDEFEDDLLIIDGELLDLEPALRDAVVPALPLLPLCQEDCPGLCGVCGVRLADNPDHSHEFADPRWEALRGLGSDSASEES